MAADVRFVGAGTHEHRKAGLMVRGSLEPDAPYVNATVHGDGLVSLQYRETPGGETKEVKASLAAVPVSLRLTRTSDAFTFFTARPGEELQESGSVTLALEGPVYVGLAVCSHETGVVETAVFSNMRFEPSTLATR